MIVLIDFFSDIYSTVLQCSCKFECEKGNLLAAHFITCRRTMRVLLKTKGKKKEEGEEGDEEADLPEEKEEEEEKKIVKEQSVEDEQQEKEEVQSRMRLARNRIRKHGRF